MSVFPTLIQFLSTRGPHFQKVLRCKLEAASVQREEISVCLLLTETF